MFALFYTKTMFNHDYSLFCGTPVNMLLNYYYVTGLSDCCASPSAFGIPQEDIEQLEGIAEMVHDSDLSAESVADLNLTLSIGSFSCLKFAKNKEELEELKAFIISEYQKNKRDFRSSMEDIEKRFKALDAVYEYSANCCGITEPNEDIDYDYISGWDAQLNNLIQDAMISVL